MPSRLSPFTAALSAYWDGDVSASFLIERDDGHVETVAARDFFDDVTFPENEVLALSLCKGRVLDVGACVGRHSIALRRRGFQVTPLEIEEGCRTILERRGFEDIIIEDINKYCGRSFDTVLMLSNGIGIFGSIPKLEAFLIRLPALLEPGGQLICDSTDISASLAPQMMSYRNRNISNGRPGGRVCYRICYKNKVSEPFSWLYLSTDELALHCRRIGLKFQLLREAAHGQYLARIMLSALAAQ